MYLGLGVQGLRNLGTPMYEELLWMEPEQEPYRKIRTYRANLPDRGSYTQTGLGFRV